MSLFHIMNPADLIFPHTEGVPTFGPPPFVFLLHLYHFYNDFSHYRTWTVTSKMGKFTPSTQCHHFISGLAFIPFLYTDIVYRLGLCNHLADHWGAEGAMLSKCSLSVITVNKAPVWPVLNCTCVVMLLESPDHWHLTKPCIFLTGVNSELRASHRLTSSDS